MRRRSTRWAVLAAAAMIGPALATPALAAGPDPDSVFVQSIAYGGTGCSQGTVGQSISSDRVTFTLIFDSFVASTGPGVPITEARKNCQLDLNLHLPSVDVKRLDIDLVYRGYAQLAAGTTGVVKSTVFFAGEVTQDEQQLDLAGPVAKDYLFEHTVAFKHVKVDSAPCGGVVPVNVNSQVALNGPPNTASQLTIDSIDGSLTSQNFNGRGHLCGT